MIGAYASMALLCGAALVAGQAVLVLCGRPDARHLAGPVGLAALLVVSGIAIKLPGHDTAVAIALCLLTAVSIAVLLSSKRGDAGGGPEGASEQDCERPASHGRRAPFGGVTAGAPLIAGALALLLASLPFIASGRVGILGVGLVNDDMANHLTVAEWIGTHVGHMPTLISQGYPVGPHALVDAVSSLLGTSLVNGFAGLTLALPVLTAIMVAGALREARPFARVAVGVLVAVPYLVAAYLAQEAFKEPIEAFLILGFALYMPTVKGVRDSLPAALITAGVIYAYSFPGVFWLAGATFVFWALARPRGVIKPFLGAHAILLVLIVPEIGRLVDFSHFKAFSESTANAGGLGNLRHQLSPFEALGVWPTSEFRLAAADAAHPIAYYAGAALGVAGLILGAPRWVRRHGWGVPAALATAAVIYVGALVTGTVYTSAKALAIASPLVLLIALGGLAEGLGRRVALGALAGLLGIAALASSFLVLRQAPVAPSTHASELASFRHVIGDRKVLFLGRDNFIQFELHPARPFVAVRNYYDNDYVRPNLKLGPEVFKKFDFDSVKPEDLVRFPFVITTRGRYASGPPPWLQPAGETPSFLLWKRVTKGPTLDRHVLDEGDAPGAILNCRDRSSLPAAGIASYFPKLPVTGADWSGGPTVESGSSVSQALRLTRGTWDVSLQYDATQPVHLSGPGLDVTIPANLDYRGTTPYYAAGELLVKKAGDATITVSVERPPFMGRLLGASSIAHLGGIALTLAKPDSGLPLRGACGKYVDWYAEN